MLDQVKAPLPAMDLPITDEPLTSFTLSSAYYTDAEVYEREKELIFARTWQYVAHKSHFEKAGDYATARIADQNVFVMLGDDGEFRAFYNVCRHRAHELLPDGMGNVKNTIVCPYHAWAYEKSGALRGAPNSQARPGFDKTNYGLRQVRLEEFLGCLFVNLDDNAVPLADQAGDLADDIQARVPFLDDLKPLRDMRLGNTLIDAGWKVVVDNYVECYHCTTAHPAFSSLICMDKYQVDTFGLWSRQLGDEIRTKNDAYPVDPEYGLQNSAFWYLWPNTTFNILPGCNELSVFVIRPINALKSDFTGHILSSDGKPDEKRWDYTADVLGPEDVDLCESVQRGLLSNGYDQGPIIVDEAHAGTGEQAIHHFHRLVYQALNG